MSKKATPTTRAGAGGRLAEALEQAQQYAALAARREPASKVVAVRVPAALFDGLTAAAAARGIHLAELARLLLAEGLELLREEGKPGGDPAG